MCKAKQEKPPRNDLPKNRSTKREGTELALLSVPHDEALWPFLFWMESQNEIKHASSIRKPIQDH